MKRRFLLIGSNGQVGRDLSALLPNIGDVTAFDRSQLDLTAPDEIRQVIRSIRPEVIVNAAAHTAVDKAESEEALARAINATAPGVLAEEAKKIGALLVHYSTDYVFDGTKNEPYDEDDTPNPQSAYGRTKLAGEQAIQQSGAAHLIFRTAWVYAPEGRNFLLTILRLATQKEELRIVRDQIGAPTRSQQIAAATVQALSKVCAQEGPVFANMQSGVYHLTAPGETSWYEFARTILEEAAKLRSAPPWFLAATQQRPLITTSILPITTAEFPTPARRPAYSVLSNARLAKEFGIRLPDWKMQLHSVFQPSS